MEITVDSSAMVKFSLLQGGRRLRNWKRSMENGMPALYSRPLPEGYTARRWDNVVVPLAKTREEPRANANIITLGTPVGGVLKRTFDIIVASASIVLLFPLFCLTALAIKRSDRGPVFFRHQRVGLNGATFNCLKFRTMVVDAEEVLQRYLSENSDAAREWAELHKLKKDPRVTPLGTGIRKSSLDELPQLLNILKGEMSFVGPRPIVSAEVPKYGECIGHYLRARPGLTGPWQAGGRNDVGYATRVALDREYVEHWSFWRDLAIIARTVRALVTSRGCY
jgi:exopolysaccharide production protein ExoY